MQPGELTNTAMMNNMGQPMQMSPATAQPMGGSMFDPQLVRPSDSWMREQGYQTGYEDPRLVVRDMAWMEGRDWFRGGIGDSSTMTPELEAEYEKALQKSLDLFTKGITFAAPDARRDVRAYIDYFNNFDLASMQEPGVERQQPFQPPAQSPVMQPIQQPVLGGRPGQVMLPNTPTDLIATPGLPAQPPRTIAPTPRPEPQPIAMPMPAPMPAPAPAPRPVQTQRQQVLQQRVTNPGFINGRRPNLLQQQLPPRTIAPLPTPRPAPAPVAPKPAAIPVQRAQSIQNQRNAMMNRIQRQLPIRRVKR